jgi:hypothetical protein
MHALNCLPALAPPLLPEPAELPLLELSLGFEPQPASSRAAAQASAAILVA